jgi:hypothetical protein
VQIPASDATNTIEVVNGELTVGSTSINNTAVTKRGIYVHAGAKFHTDRLRAHWGNAARTSVYFAETASGGTMSIGSFEARDGLPSPATLCKFGSDEVGNFVRAQQLQPHTLSVPIGAYKGFYGKKAPDQFPTLADMKTAETDSYFSPLLDGVTVFADGVGYKREVGATTITGLPNFVYAALDQTTNLGRLVLNPFGTEGGEVAFRNTAGSADRFVIDVVADDSLRIREGSNVVIKISSVGGLLLPNLDEYASHAAASTGGVALNEVYVNSSTGAVTRRLT